MQTDSKILVWGAFNFEKRPKKGFRIVADGYSKSCKNQTKGDRDLKYGLKWLLGHPLSDLAGQHANQFQNFGLGGL